MKNLKVLFVLSKDLRLEHLKGGDSRLINTEFVSNNDLAPPLSVYPLTSSQAISLHFCILPAIKNWRREGLGMRLGRRQIAFSLQQTADTLKR